MENRQQRTIGFRSGTNYALREYMFLYLLFTYSSVKDIYKRNRQNKAVPDSEKFLLIIWEGDASSIWQRNSIYP